MTEAAVKKEYTKIEPAQIKLGIRYSAPVFFDDGENMFLAEGKTAKQYHISALEKWNIPYLLTFGHVIVEEENSVNSGSDDFDDVEELEELEDLDEVEPIG